GRVRLLSHTEGLARGSRVRPFVPLVALVPYAPVQARRSDGDGEVDVATVVVGSGAARRRRVFVGQVESVVAVRVPAGERAPGAAVPQRSGPPYVVIPAVPQVVGRCARVFRGPPGDPRPASYPAARSVHRERPIRSPVSGHES